MNNVQMMGRLTRDPEIRYTSNQTPVASFTIAVDRDYKSATGERQADFFPCIAWKGKAEFVNKYFRKGSRIILTGSLQNRSWEDTEGKRHNITEILVDKMYFGDSKKQDQSPASGYEDDGRYGQSDDDTALPFDI